MEKADKVRDFVVAAAQAEPPIARVILFGSRARGDFQERSDYDLAFDAPGWKHEHWAAFAVNLREKAPTLCHLDLVWLNTEVSEKLREVIRDEGKIIYERGR